MSIKSFHIFFITISVMFSLWFSMWTLMAYSADKENTFYVVLGIAALIAAILLVLYGVKVYRKLKTL